MKICVLDIETCDTTATAVVPALGITVIDTKQPRPELLAHVNSNKALFLRLDCYEQYKQDRTRSQDTLDWWQKQSEEAQNLVFSEQNNVTVDEAKTKLVKFMKKHKPQRIYTRGPHFDYVILCSLFAEYPEFEKAFVHWNVRDFRTIVEFHTNKATVKTEHEGFIYHHPTHDAVRDAIAIWDAWDWKKQTIKQIAEQDHALA